MAREGWSAGEAEKWLVAAGTATNYPGLYETVRTFHPPAPEQLKALASDFPETTRVPDLVAAMVEIDQRFDNLKSVRAAGYVTPKDHPDLQAGREAALLWENYREAQRMPESRERGRDFLSGLRDAETHAKQLETLLRQASSSSNEPPAPPLREELDRAFEALKKNCASCHKRYRNPSRIH
jgi:hypothetical protein